MDTLVRLFTTITLDVGRARLAHSTAVLTLCDGSAFLVDVLQLAICIPKKNSVSVPCGMMQEAVTGWRGGSNAAIGFARVWLRQVLLPLGGNRAEGEARKGDEHVSRRIDPSIQTVWHATAPFRFAVLPLDSPRKGNHGQLGSRWWVHHYRRGGVEGGGKEGDAQISLTSVLTVADAVTPHAGLAGVLFTVDDHGEDGEDGETVGLSGWELYGRVEM